MNEIDKDNMLIFFFYSQQAKTILHGIGMLDQIHQNIEKQAQEIDISCDKMLTIESHSRNSGKEINGKKSNFN